MKKIGLFLSILFVLGVVTNSCIYEKVNEVVEGADPGPDPGPGPSEPTKKTFYLRFNTGEIAGITSYASPDLNNSVMIWGSSEYAGLFMIGDNTTSMFHNKQYYLNSDGTAIGNMSALLYDTITTSIQTATGYSYYPFQSSISGTIVSYRLNSDQSQSADKTSAAMVDNAISDNVFMISPLSEAFNLNGGTGIMTFENVFAFLRIQVIKSALFTTFNQQRIKRVKLYIADKKDLSKPLTYDLAGNYSIDVSKAPSKSGYTAPVFSAGENIITAVVTGGVAISELTSSSPYIWFVINPLTVKSNECLVSVIETELYTVISSYDITTIKANNVYTLSSIAEEKNTVSDKVVSTYFLDDEASACYVIPRAGVCQIPLKTASGAELKGDTVEWLWASKENGGSTVDINELIDPSTIKYNESGGYVRFRVGTNFGKYTKGNVVLALKDENKEIVWTWHIWITDDLKDVQYEGGKYFLDRNIGALSAQMTSSGIDNYGFVYQWGRKDPFFGGDGVTHSESMASILSVARNNTIVNTSAFAAGVAQWYQASEVNSLSEIQSKPMRFNFNGISSKDDPADWLVPSDPTRWSDNTKTDYDPCPSGYKVPSRSDLSSLHKAGNFNNKGQKYWEYSFGTMKTIWPSAGMRAGRVSLTENQGGAQLIYSGTDAAKGQCFYWTSTPFKSGGSHRIYASDRNILHHEDNYGDNADAYPIRCVKMDTP